MDHEPGPVRGDRTVAFRREVALVETVLTALAPVVVTLLLGFVAAWHHDFAAKDAAVLNRMVLLYAVPVALFVGTVGTPRSELVQDVAFAVAMCVIACRMADSASGWSWTMPTNFAGVFLM
jgi:predicted permease